jgi:hypothetical protein
MRHRVDRDLDGLNGGGVGRCAELASDPRDLPRELDIALTQPEPVVPDGDEPHGDTVVPNIDVRLERAETIEVTDRERQKGTGRGLSGREVRAHAVVLHPPILDTFGLEELVRRDPLGHPRNVAGGRWSAPRAGSRAPALECFDLRLR